MLNIGGIETTGLDWSVSFVTNEQDWGSLDVTWANTHLFDYTEFTEGPNGVVSTSREGTELGSPERGYLEWRSTLTTNKIDATFNTDVQATWTPDNLGGRWSFQAGIQNLFDEDTPICYSCDLNSFDGTLYPIPGSFWFARVGYSLDKEKAAIGRLFFCPKDVAGLHATITSVGTPVVTAIDFRAATIMTPVDVLASAIQAPVDLVAFAIETIGSAITPGSICAV